MMFHGNLSYFLLFLEFRDYYFLWLHNSAESQKLDSGFNAVFLHNCADTAELYCALSILLDI